jgi:hypothetical protein
VHDFTLDYSYQYKSFGSTTTGLGGECFAPIGATGIFSYLLPSDSAATMRFVRCEDEWLVLCLYEVFVESCVVFVGACFDFHEVKYRFKQINICWFDKGRYIGAC